MSPRVQREPILKDDESGDYYDPDVPGFTFTKVGDNEYLVKGSDIRVRWDGSHYLSSERLVVTFDNRLFARAKGLWDSTVEEIRGVMGSEHGVEVSAGEVESYLSFTCSIDDPREADFEIDDEEDLESFSMELGSAVEGFPKHYLRAREIPTEVYERYAEIYENEREGSDEDHGMSKKKKKLDPKRLGQNTTATAEFLEQSGVAHQSLLGQRSYPGMRDLGEEEELDVQTAPTSLLNIHAEMLGLYRQMEAMVQSGLVHVMLNVHPSQPVCFFCEIMLRLFNVGYDTTFVDRRMFPKWVDPSGFLETEEGGYFTPREMLNRFNYDVEGAVERVLPLFQDIEDPQPFIDRILSGELQGGALRKLIKDLKAASPALAQANDKAKVGSGGMRGPSKSSKAGRRALRLQQQKRKRQSSSKSVKESKEKKKRTGIPVPMDFQQQAEAHAGKTFCKIDGFGLNCYIRSVITWLARHGHIPDSGVEDAVANIARQLARTRLRIEGETIDAGGLAAAEVRRLVQHAFNVDIYITIVQWNYAQGTVVSFNANAGTHRVVLLYTPGHFDLLD